MSRLPIPHIINTIKTKLGFDRTMTASGDDVVDAVNKQSRQIGNVVLKGQTHTLSAGGTLNNTITLSGLTANHVVANWGLSVGTVSNPPADIEITEAANAYTVVVSNVTADFSFTPTFVLPQNLT